MWPWNSSFPTRRMSTPSIGNFWMNGWTCHPDDRYSLGFCVAQPMKLSCVDASDLKNESDSLTIGDVMECAKTVMPELYPSMMQAGEQRNQNMQHRANHQSSRETLRWMNHSEALTGVLRSISRCPRFVTPTSGGEGGHLASSNLAM